MEILINGQTGLVETDGDVSLKGLHAYLQEQLAGQGLIIRTFTVDGEDLFFDQPADVHEKMVSEFNKCEVDCVPAEQIAWDILTELEDKPALLGEEAVKITEEMQTGKAKEASERLVRFSNSISYIINGITGANGIIQTNLTETLAGEENERIGKIGEYLKEIESAIGEEDLTTVGDVLEFDLAPALGVLTNIIQRLKADLAAKAEAAQNDSPATEEEN